MDNEDSEPKSKVTKLRAAAKRIAAVPVDAKEPAAADDEAGDVAGTGAGPVLRKKDLLERVQAQSKAKKKDVKDVVEAVLTVLGEALAKGEELNLPPLGKARVGRHKGVSGGELYIIKLRRAGAKGEGPSEPLAGAAE